MKRSSALLSFCIALMIISSSGQLSFTNPYVSNTNSQEWTVTDKTYGKLLTLSTTKGFSWIIADAMADGDTIFITSVCVSSGSTADWSIATYVTNGYPNSYSADSVVLPVVGGFFSGLSADTRAWYNPTKATLSQSFTTQPTAPISSRVYMFQKQPTTVKYGLYTGSTTNYASSTSITTFNTMSFEVLNCGTTTFCIQTLSEFQQSQGICEPGETETCQAPATCSTVTDQSDCSTDSSFVIDDLSCVSQCYNSLQNSVSTKLSVCGAQCTSPCLGCSGTVTTCTSCIDGYLLDSGSSVCNQCASHCTSCSGSVTHCTSCEANYYLHVDNTCVNPCPAGYEADSSSEECKKIKVSVQSSSFAIWKLALAIGIPSVVILSGIIIFMHIKFGKRSQAYSTKETPQEFNQLPTSPSADTSPTAAKGMETQV